MTTTHASETASAQHPAGEAGPVVRAILEDVLLSLRGLPPAVPRGPIASGLEAAVMSLSRLGETRIDHPSHVEHIESAVRQVAELSAKLQASGESPPVLRALRRVREVEKALAVCREQTIEALVARQDRMLRAPSFELHETPLRPFRASVGAPSLQAFARAQVDLAVDVRPGLPDDLIDDAEDVERPEPPRRARHAKLAALDESAHLRAVARDGLGDLASLEPLRSPLPEHVWTVARKFEQRLLDNLDAIVALGVPDAAAAGELRAADARTAGFDVLAEVQAFGDEAPFADPGRAFARAFVLGCVDGEDTAEAALISLRQAHPAVRSAIASALSVTPHPGIGPALTRLLSDAVPALLTIALEVLRFRRETSFAVAAPLTHHPDPRVAAAAARALGIVSPRKAAIEALSFLLEEDDEEEVSLAAAEALLVHGDGEGLAFARGKLGDAAASGPEGMRLGWMRLVAMAGNAGDLELLRGALRPTARDATLAGWYGHAGLLGWLVQVLGEANAARDGATWVEPIEVAAAQALERITGAGLRDAPSGTVAYDFASEPTIFASTWERSLAKEGRDRLPPGPKYRGGALYAPIATVDELAGASRASLRADAALELAIVAGASAFEPRDWVTRQLVALADVRSRLTTRSSATDGSERQVLVQSPGEWPADRLRRSR